MFICFPILTAFEDMDLFQGRAAKQRCGVFSKLMNQYFSKQDLGTC